MASITIIKAPFGEAPLWFREAWIGISLPTRDKRPRTYQSFGVLSGPRDWFGSLWRQMLGEADKVPGYVVPSGVAIDLLERVRPDAAAWWRSNAPTFMAKGVTFVFDADACRPNDSIQD